MERGKTFTKRLERTIIALVIVTGISSVVTQIITIREFLSQFQGNEIIIALTFFNWLMSGAAGTFMSHAVSKRFHPSPRHLAWLSILLATLAVFQIPVIRILRNTIFLTGSSVGFYPSWLFTLLTTLPYCTILGFVLPYSLFVLRRYLSEDYPGAKIYIIDNIGDISGGVLFSTALVFLLTPIKAVALANIPLFLFAGRLSLFEPGRVEKRRTTPDSLVTLLLLAMGVAAITWSLMNERSTLSATRCNLVYYDESRYGRIMMCEDNGQFTLIQDGEPVFSSENRALAEESVHYLMSQIAAPRRVLIISALAGIIKEIEKYSVEQIDYVELDPKFTDTVFRFHLLEHESNVHPVHTDGRAWLSKVQEKYDAIIINLPEPDTFQTNRFYTQEFYRLAKSRLAPGGGVLFSAQGYDSYIGGPELEKISIMKNTAASVFSHVMLIPGNRVFFICADHELEDDIPALLEKRGISTWYIKNFFHGNITHERISQLYSSLLETPINTDLMPRLMKVMFEQWFFKYSSSPYIFTAALLGMTMLYVWSLTRSQFVIFSTGALVMGCETLVIFTFQAFYGYIYFLIGILITVFLAGLLPGAIAGRKIPQNLCMPILRYSDMALIAAMGLFTAWIAAGKGPATPEWCFLAFGFMVSVLCGLQFPAVLSIEGDTDTSAAHTFSADIAGAALGPLLVSLFLIPWTGLLGAGMALMGLKALSLAMLYRQ